MCRAICGGCAVRVECAEAAVSLGEPWGIWGGLDTAERAAVAAAQDIPAPRALPVHGTNARYAKHGCRCTACRHAHAIYERGRRQRSPSGHGTVRCVVKEVRAAELSRHGGG